MKLRWLVLCLVNMFLPAILVVNVWAGCPGTEIAVSVSSPSSSGTFASPTRFTATATSTQGQITGYAVYSDDLVVYENDNTTTLDGWRILPLTNSGGAQTHDVFVRAWDSVGNCGDSSHLSITSSGTRIPTPLAGSQTFDNVDDDQTGDFGVTHGWGYSLTEGGGNPPDSMSLNFGQSPTLDSDGSLLLSMTGGQFANALFFYDAGAHNALSNFLWDFYFQLSNNTSTQAQAIEFDFWQVIAGQKYMFGTQCDYSRGVWQAWNETGTQWVDAIPNTATDANPTGTAISCSRFSPGTWHHAQYFVQRTFGGRLLYGNVTIDGVTTQWNISAPSAPVTNWADSLGLQQQLDTNDQFSGTVTLREWTDKNKFVGWPQD